MKPLLAVELLDRVDLLWRGLIATVVGRLDLRSGYRTKLTAHAGGGGTART